LSDSKASLVRQLKERGLPVPKGATVGDLKHRLKHWKGGKGYLMRLALPPRSDSVAAMLEYGKVYWVPNSDFAEQMAKTKVVYIVGMELNPPTSVTVLDVPKGF